MARAGQGVRRRCTGRATGAARWHTPEGARPPTCLQAGTPQARPRRWVRRRRRRLRGLGRAGRRPGRRGRPAAARRGARARRRRRAVLPQRRAGAEERGQGAGPGYGVVPDGPAAGRLGEHPARQERHALGREEEEVLARHGLRRRPRRQAAEGGQREREARVRREGEERRLQEVGEVHEAAHPEGGRDGAGERDPERPPGRQQQSGDHRVRQCR
mmetsp:Transcript_11078/g.35116  ORF Transcript_11078/g.35116 Transcript_11078/m.35116 type:complete len:215 (+) Transcript_11078:1690-2334(+)